MPSFQAASTIASCVRTEYPAQSGGQEIPRRRTKIRDRNNEDNAGRRRVIVLTDVSKQLRALKTQASELSSLLSLSKSADHCAGLLPYSSSSETWVQDLSGLKLCIFSNWLRVVDPKSLS